MHQPSHTSCYHVITPTAGVGTIRSKPCYGAVYDRGVDLLDLIVAQSHSVELPRHVVLHHDVALGSELLQHCLAPGSLHVYAEARYQVRRHDGELRAGEARHYG